MVTDKKGAGGVIRVTTTVEIDVTELLERLTTMVGSVPDALGRPAVRESILPEAMPADVPAINTRQAYVIIARAMLGVAGGGLPNDAQSILHDFLADTGNLDLQGEVASIHVEVGVPAGSPAGAFNEFLANLILEIRRLLKLRGLDDSKPAFDDIASGSHLQDVMNDIVSAY